MVAAPSLAPRPRQARAPLILVPPLKPPQFIGLARCAAEGWTVIRYPVSRSYLLGGGPWKAVVERRRRLYAAELRELRRRGAIVVACQTVGRQNQGDHHRVWYFGLPPADWTGDLRVLARAAGMCVDKPQTFAWNNRGKIW
jgi:hypothetical protein